MKKIKVSEAFKKFMPERAVFVLSIDKRGISNGMVASWNMKCSEEPPLLAVSLWKQCNTQRLIRESKEFVISVPNKSLEKQVRFFGSCHGDKVDKFKETKIRTLPSRHIRTPMLKDATINFECRLEKTVDAGECYIFIGKILASYMNKKKKILLYTKDNKGKRAFQEF